MKENNKWLSELQRLPLVVTVSVGNQESTIFDCLCSVLKVANVTLVVFDNSTDASAKEIDKFIRREKPSNFYVFDLTRQDPWPDLKDASPSAVLGRSQYKSLQLARSVITDGLWLSVHPNVTLHNTARQIAYETACSWKNPLVDYSFLKTEKSSSFMPIAWLKSVLFPGPKSVSENPALYAKLGNQVSIQQPVLISNKFAGVYQERETL